MSDNDSLIRITKEEATSTHVDDLLRRQMSLRGEPGVVRDRGRRWYYQSWLIFGLVGAIGAILAWALLEPYFDDLLYIQGTITSLDLSDELFRRITDADPTDSSLSIAGTMKLKGERILILRNAKILSADGNKKKLDVENLHVGDNIGVYVEYVSGREENVGIGEFIVQNPPPQPQKRSRMSLEHLHARSQAAGLLLFAVVAGAVGLLIGAVDGLICRLPRRALICGVVGLLVGFIGGFMSHIAANLAYGPLHALAAKQTTGSLGSLSTFGFLIQMIGRSLAWCLAGMAMGLGQGIALRSKRLLIYGLLGGVIGGLVGGLLFDPIDLLILGPDKPSAHWSRLIGFAVIGLGVGAMIGVVELLARDAWLRMTQGPLTGKEFLLFKDVMSIGSSPKADIYLFNDPQVGEQHAVIRAVGDECEIEARQKTLPVLLNNRPLERARLRHGDNVTIGRTSFVFQRRKG